MQGVLAEALGRVLRLPAPPDLTVAGRTDAGVHARGQVVHADVSATAWTTAVGNPAGPPPQAARTAPPPQAARTVLLARLASALPPDVRVRAVAAAPEGFDARFSALWRR